MNVLNPLNRRPSRIRLLHGLAAPLAAAIMMAMPTTSFAGFFLSVNIAPPPLPVYEQPVMPGDGYMWTPGYWAYSDDGYFWVPGTWVMPPNPGLLWTPGYWGYGDGGVYLFHSGYWGAHIGFYGGVNYGFGYGGIGYGGGYWNNGGFYYNRGYNNFGGVHVTNVYNKTIISNGNNGHTSFNGGTGGIAARPTGEELQAAHERHVQPVAAQQHQVEAASQNKAMFASVNHGAPAVAATSKPGEFTGAGVVAAHPVSPEDRAAVDKAVAAKPVGKPVGSAAEMASHSAPRAVGAPRAASAMASHGASHAMTAPSHGSTGSPASHAMSHPMSQPHASQPHPSAPRPMAQPHPAAPRPMAQPHPAQRAPAPQKEKDHH